MEGLTPRTKVGIIIIVYNISNLVSRQISLIKKYCKDPNYDIIIIDNSTDLKVAEEIMYYTKQGGAKYVKIFSAETNGSESNIFACNLAYNIFREWFDFFVYLDHDTFPLRDFSVLQILEGRAIAGLGQTKSKTYFSQNTLLWDNRTIPHELINFSASHKLGLDTGGMLYKVIDHVTVDGCVFFNEKYYQNPYYRTGFYNFYSTINDDMFMHFINSSNWNPTEDNEARINGLINVLDERTK